MSETSDLGAIRMDPAGPVVAGNEGRWVFTYTAGARGLAVGGGVVLRSPKTTAARMHIFDWDFGQVRCYSKSAARLTPAIRDFDWRHSPCLAVTVHGAPVQPGERIEIVMGDVTGSSPHRLARAQWAAHPDVGFTAWVDVDGSGELEPLPDYPRFAVVPGPAHVLRVALPAVAPAGEPLRAAIHAEDRCTNVATGCDDRLTVGDRSVCLDQGCCEVADVRPAGQGTRRVRVTAEPSGLAAVSSASWDELVADRHRIFFGDLHAQMCKDPSRYPSAWVSGDPAALYDYARRVSALDFVAHVEVCSPTDGAAEIVERLFGAEPRPKDPAARMAHRVRRLPPTLTYADRMAAADAHDEPGRFVAFAAYEWGGRPCHRNVIFRNKAGHCFGGIARTPQELCACRAADPAASISIPHTINGSSDHSRWDQDRALDADGFFDHGRTYHKDMCNWGPLHWDKLDTESEPVIELCQSRGSFETDAPGNGVVLGGFGASARDGLALGKRVGFVAGTDTHLGRPGGRDCFGPTWDDRHGALTGVLAPELTRESLFDAIRARRTYAATDRILLDVRLNGRLMGEELHAADAGVRRLTLRVAGTGALDRVDVVRNNADVLTVRPGGPDLETEWTDPEPLDSLLAASPCGAVWYYVRVRQADGEMAWSSPIWIA